MMYVIVLGIWDVCLGSNCDCQVLLCCGGLDDEVWVESGERRVGFVRELMMLILACRLGCCIWNGKEWSGNCIHGCHAT